MSKSFKITLIILSVIVLLVVACSIVISQTQKNLDALKGIGIEDIDLSTLPDGTYKGSYNSFPISVTVDVTVEDSKIAKIALIKHINGQGKAAEEILENVVKAQSLQVDVISGATYSSKVILLAIKDALKNAV